MFLPGFCCGFGEKGVFPKVKLWAYRFEFSSFNSKIFDLVHLERNLKNRPSPEPIGILACIIKAYTQRWAPIANLLFR